MPSDFRNIAESGQACVGCGRGVKEGLSLKRLRTYARSLACLECIIRYAACGNKNPAGAKCGDSPRDHEIGLGACKRPGCGCERYMHGLEREFDRQLAESVGKNPTFATCGGFGAKLGQCGATIFILPGMHMRLCSACEREWVSQTRSQAEEMAKLFNLGKDNPQ